mmetsp:Transcript_15589/g.26341  ORF Transcript_15589/g.26341 Transcript_15589/m.26341 type:complete len:81 (+) Transcript_15589:431-673(+)
MPLDSRKLKEMLRHQGSFRDRINREIGTYEDMKENTDFEQGVLTYIARTAIGKMKDLLDDIGVRKDALDFVETDEFEKAG